MIFHNLHIENLLQLFCIDYPSIMRFWICSNFPWFVAQPGWNLRKFQLEQLERSFSTHHLDRYTRCHRCCRLRRCPCLACLACCLQVSGCQLRLKGSRGILIIMGHISKGLLQGNTQSIAIFQSFQLFFYVFNAYALHPVKDHLIPNNCHTIFQYISLEERPVLQPRHKKPLLSYSGTVYFK